MSEKVKAHIFVGGLVQGVFFRQNTLRRAKKLGIFGFVKNLPDGRVEAVFEGDKDKIEEIVDWTRKGPEHANVNDQKVEWGKYTGAFNRFEIIY